MQQLSDVLFIEKQVSVSVLRLDTIHPVVSGNKLFKLHYFFQKAREDAATGILTYGGAYSNHLVATSLACKLSGIPAAAIVRGEKPALLSHTLQACLEYGMSLEFVSRQVFDQRDEPGFVTNINAGYENYLVIPEGGYHPLGAAGAALIMKLLPPDITHVCCAVGTATTAAGLWTGLKETQQLIAIPVLKNLHDLEARIRFLTKHSGSLPALKIWPDYHFGGYAKKTTALLDFMNQLYREHALPTDFVYTGKMMFGVMDNIAKDFFRPGSKIVCIHTGGLQGNLSLKPGSLVFGDFT